MDNFELIEMLNETHPNFVSGQAMLVISASHSMVEDTYAHLLERIEIELGFSASTRLPHYLLRKTKNLLMQNEKEIKLHVEHIVNVIEYFAEELLIKRLTILSFEEGSLLCLRALSVMKPQLFAIINKMVLINPFNPTIMILHGSPRSFVEETKNRIIADPKRLSLVNDTKIIIVHTLIDSNQNDSPINWLIKNSKGEYVTFANSIFIHSRNMWNVYSYLRPEEYFVFSPFNEMITGILIGDRDRAPHSINYLKNVILFSRVSTQGGKSLQNHNLMENCVHFNLEQYNRKGDIFTNKCVIVKRNNDFFFNNGTEIIVKSNGEFHLFGEEMEIINPYEIGKQHIYLIQNINNWNYFIISNKNMNKIKLQVFPLFTPQMTHEGWPEEYEIPFSKRYHHLVGKTYSKIRPTRENLPIYLCPDFTVLQPSDLIEILAENWNLFSHSAYENGKVDTNNCFIGINIYLSQIRIIYRNWSLGLNLIVFSIFCLHVTKTSTFSRLFLQIFINSFLTYFHSSNFLISENIVLMIVILIVELFLYVVHLMCSIIPFPRNLVIKVLWIPLFLEALDMMGWNVFFSSWKAIGLLFFTGVRKENIAVLFLETCFILDYAIREVSNVQGLFLCCAWLVFSSLENEEKETEKKKPSRPSNNDIIIVTTGRRLKNLRTTILKLRKQIVDTATVCLMAMCLSENGVTFHFILDFYITAIIIFEVQQKIEDLG